MRTHVNPDYSTAEVPDSANIDNNASIGDYASIPRGRVVIRSPHMSTTAWRRWQATHGAWSWLIGLHGCVVLSNVHGGAESHGLRAAERRPCEWDPSPHDKETS